MVSIGASDLHLTSGMPPLVRMDGHMKPLEASLPPLEPAQIQELLAEITPEKNRTEFTARHDTDFAYEIRAWRGSARTCFWIARAWAPCSG